MERPTGSICRVILGVLCSVDPSCRGRQVLEYLHKINSLEQSMCHDDSLGKFPSLRGDGNNQSIKRDSWTDFLWDSHYDGWSYQTNPYVI